MDEHRNILFIVTTEEFLQEQIDLVHNMAKTMCFNATSINISSLDDLNKVFDECYSKFNYIYIAGHGNIEGTVIGDDNKHYYWSDIIKLFNLSGCFCDSSLIFIQGCHSHNASNFILNTSKDITDVIGFETELNNIDAYISFINFLYYTVMLELGTFNAVEKVKNTIYDKIIYSAKE